MNSLVEQITDALRQIHPAALDTDIVSAGAVKHLQCDEQTVVLHVQFGFPATSVAAGFERRIEQLLIPYLGERKLQLTVDWEVKAHITQGQTRPLPTVRNVILVSSGKGGVGKSTTTVNLALALAAEGAKVGLLDADLFGPSLPLMMGLPEGTRPAYDEAKNFIPPKAHGVEVMSINFMVDEAKTPVVWRGPKASGAVLQLAQQTRWGDLDYLLVDMPPGTSDIQLTVAQRIPVAGSVVVTTPQEVALADARKGIEMFDKVGVHVLGVVENMAVHVCTACGNHDAVFGHQGGQQLAQEYETELLASLPLVATIREHADAGTPLVLAAPDSAEAALYQVGARRLAGALSLRETAKPPAFARMVMKHNP